MTYTDVTIIGAGPSGSIAAGILLKNGFSVTLIEKEKFPRFVIGESLIPRVMDHLEEGGFLDHLNKQNFEKKYGARFLRDGKECEFLFSDKYTDGWEWTWQMPRADFDLALTEVVQEKGGEILFEHMVKNVEFKENEVVTTISDKNQNIKTISSKYIIDGSGYGRVLPRLLGLEKPSDLSPKGALFTHIEDTKRPEGREGTCITFDILDQELWYWVIPFSNGKTSLGLVGTPPFFDGIDPEDTASKMKEMMLTSEYYKDRFKEEEFLFDPHYKYAYSVGVEKLYGDRFVLTGNSTEFLDPVFSSGVSFAAESAAVAARLVTKELNGEKVDWEKDYSKYILRGVEVFKSYIKNWYDGSLQELFYSENVNSDIKKQITSILAGYVWDDTNIFVKRHKTVVKTLNHFNKQNFMMEEEKS